MVKIFQIEALLRQIQNRIVEVLYIRLKQFLDLTIDRFAEKDKIPVARGFFLKFEGTTFGAITEYLFEETPFRWFDDLTTPTAVPAP